MNRKHFVVRMSLYVCKAPLVSRWKWDVTGRKIVKMARMKCFVVRLLDFLGSCELLPSLDVYCSLSVVPSLNFISGPLDTGPILTKLSKKHSDYKMLSVHLKKVVLLFVMQLNLGKFWSTFKYRHLIFNKYSLFIYSCVIGITSAL
jgi:hypothetical protein